MTRGVPPLLAPPKGANQSLSPNNHPTETFKHPAIRVAFAGLQSRRCRSVQIFCFRVKVSTDPTLLHPVASLALTWSVVSIAPCSAKTLMSFRKVDGKSHIGPKGWSTEKERASMNSSWSARANAFTSGCFPPNESQNSFHGKSSNNGTEGGENAHIARSRGVRQIYSWCRYIAPIFLRWFSGSAVNDT